MSASVKEISSVIQRCFAPEALRIERGHDGALSIHVLSEHFAAQEDPHHEFEETLKREGVALPPRTFVFLKAPSALESPEERVRYLPQPRGLPTWGDAALLEPETPPRVDERRLGAARVIAFWGLKGGVGRSTALANSAVILGKRFRVLAVDLDLESPGLVATLAQSNNDPNRPRFDQLLADAANGQVSDEDLLERVRGALYDCKDEGARVRVLGPESVDMRLVRNLLGPLAPAMLYRGVHQPLRRVLRLAAQASEAEFILLDVRSGYCDESALAVLDLADEVFVFVSPAPSLFSSLLPAIDILERNRRTFARPKLVHAVAAMLPAAAETRSRILSILQDTLDQAGVPALSDPQDPPPAIGIIAVDYTPRVVENEGILIPSALEAYREIAERISAQRPSASPDSVGWVRDALLEINIPVAQAESEDDADQLAKLFTRTADLERFVRRDICLVLGAKGAGKSFLRLMCLNHPDHLRRRSSNETLGRTTFVDGYSRPQGGLGHDAQSLLPFINADTLIALQASTLSWSALWSAIALSRALSTLRRRGDQLIDLLPKGLHKGLRALLEDPEVTKVPTRLISLAKMPLVLDEAWRLLDARFEQKNENVVLLFDDLDTALGESAPALKQRKALIEGLLDRTASSWLSRRNLSAKVFLREDLFRAIDPEEGAKYATRSVTLHWKAEDIYRLVIRAVAVGSKTFDERLQLLSVNVDRLEETSEEDLLKVLRDIWGERMGEGESKTRSRVWVYERLRDSKGRMFPRTALWLLQESVEQRKRMGIPEAPPLLDPRSLRDSIPTVSEYRLTELRKESSSEDKRNINFLREMNSYQDEKNFLQGLKKAGASKPETVVTQLKDIGIIETGERRNRIPTVRIVDLYALAPSLQINRVGRR